MVISFALLRGTHPLDLAAPLVPAAAAAYAGLQLAPFAELPPIPVAAASAVTLYLIGGALMRRTGEEEPSSFAIAAFGDDEGDWVEEEDEDFLAIDETDSNHETEEFVAEDVDIEEGVLLLEDALERATPDSRVVRLFEAQPMPTAGELQQRIDRHLGREPAPEAGDELKQAIADLRHALRG